MAKYKNRPKDKQTVNKTFQLTQILQFDILFPFFHKLLILITFFQSYSFSMLFLAMVTLLVTIDSNKKYFDKANKE